MSHFFSSSFLVYFRFIIQYCLTTSMLFPASSNNVWYLTVYSSSQQSQTLMQLNFMWFYICIVTMILLPSLKRPKSFCWFLCYNWFFGTCRNLMNSFPWPRPHVGGHIQLIWKQLIYYYHKKSCVQQFQIKSICCILPTEIHSMAFLAIIIIILKL